MSDIINAAEMVLAAVRYINLQRIVDILLNAVVISAPTGIFLAMLTALLLIGPDILENARIIYLPVLSYVILYNILFYYNLNEIIIFIISSFTMLLVLIIKLKQVKVGQAIKAVVYMAVSMIISLLLEHLYLHLFYFVVKNINGFFNSTILFKFFLLVPIRIFELSLIHFVFCSKLSLPKNQ